MRVADLTELMRSLGKTFRGDSAKVAAELEKLASGLEPFAELTVSQFNELLAGWQENTPQQHDAGKPSTTHGQAIDQEQVDRSVAALQQLFESATRADTTYAIIEAEVRRIGKPLKKEEAIAAAKRFGVSGKLKSKKAALREIESRISRCKEGHDHLISVRDL